MAQLLTSLVLRGTFSETVSKYHKESKLFVGVLGLEYSVPYQQFLGRPESDIDLLNIVATGNPPASALYFSYAKRTADPDEYAYSDGLLPTYLRFQPGLQGALDDAASQLPSGLEYEAQNLKIDQPTIIMEGKIAVHNADDSITYTNKALDFILPVNPPTRRVIHLSLQAGLIAHLARMR